MDRGAWRATVRGAAGSNMTECTHTWGKFMPEGVVNTGDLGPEKLGKN